MLVKNIMQNFPIKDSEALQLLFSSFFEYTKESQSEKLAYSYYTEPIYEFLFSFFCFFEITTL
jgi:hypothetical protein